MSLQAKITNTQNILRKAFEVFDDKVGLSCSFGKDSVTVLHLARQFRPEVPAIYIDTGGVACIRRGLRSSSTCDLRS